MEKNKPLILVTNDDGVHAKGIHALIEMVKPYGDIIVVAPLHGNSGMSHAITVKVPIRYKKLNEEENVTVYGCNGTPVDSVKLAMSEIVHRKPDLLVSGINHGSNASVSIVYSGTMGAVIEGCIYGIPSIGFSHLDYSSNADFAAAISYGRKVIENTLNHQLPDSTCLNVNFPPVAMEEIKGVKICRQAKGVWKEEFEKRIDPRNGEYFWLTGYFENSENGSTDTDEWALANNFVSIVPIKIDFTAYDKLDFFKKWNYEI
ncbi:MAG: 5'/3'-nucleotidase SurE [Bacteroidales bacterium]|nr:5'/3'-nucleotidase SurE [Bacteroidales bacterium]